MSHTAGPLTILRSQSTKWDEAGDYAIIDAEGYIIGEAYMTVDHLDKAAPRPSEANARLWAAAPDLYTAVKEYLAWGPMTSSDRDLHEAAFKAAINKAEGVEVQS